jgi:hypothetical protein
LTDFFLFCLGVLFHHFFIIIFAWFCFKNVSRFF